MLTPPQKMHILGKAIGRTLRFVELTQEEMTAKWRSQGYTDDDLEFFLAMLNDPPIPGDVVLPTVGEVTGKPARTFAAWAREHRTAFVA